jgi:hypothetical protein
VDENTKDLELAISEVRRTIASDGYGMSIGEIVNMYESAELDIRPEFQRLFRWTPTQKTHLVESILVGIPLPSIFVAQRDDGVWELVDGLQRLSTILQLQGLLQQADGQDEPYLVLEGTKLLPQLEGYGWPGSGAQHELPRALQLDIKRAKIDVKIIKRESSPEAKYDLFQRLNSYGSVLTPQEMRAAMIVGVNQNLFAWLSKLAANQDFIDCTGLSETKIEKSEDMELVLRFIHLHNLDAELLTLTKLRPYGQVLDDYAIALGEKDDQDSWSQLEEIFVQTFASLAAAGGADTMRQWDPKKGQFVRGYLSTSFEVFALGMGYAISNGITPPAELVETIQDFWTQTGAAASYSSGKNTEARLSITVKKGREIMAARK